MAGSVVAGLIGATIQSIGKKFYLAAFLKTFAAFTTLSAVSKALAPKAGSGNRIKGIQQTTREPAATRKMVYGKMRVGGHVVFIGNSDEGDTPDNNYLHLAIAFASHEIESYEEIYFNEDLVWDKTNGVDTDWTEVLDIYTFDGSQTAADPQLVSDCFNWTNNHKLLGIAYVHFKMLWDGDKFPNGVPNITAKIKGKKVYDPRDINQSAATPSTWLWSDNPALVLRDYLTNRYGLDEDDSAISDEAVEAAADLCDEPVSLAGGGSQNRYRCDGQLDTGNNIKTNIEYILGSMGGFLTYAGGKYIMRAASYVAPTVSFDESDLASAISVQTRRSRRSQYNTVKGTFVSIEANYKVCDYPAQVSSTYSVEDGAPVELDMPLPFVVHNQQAQRLAKIALLKSRQHIVFSASFNLKALQVKVGDTIQVSNERLGFTNKVFEIVDYALQIQAGGQVTVDLSLVESAAAVYDWTTSDQIDFLGDGENDLDNGRNTQPVSNLTGTEVGLVGPDATLQTAYRLAWELPDSRFIGDVLVSWYDTAGTLPQDLIQGFAGPEATEFLVTGLQPNNTYTFYVQTINLIGVKSDPVQLQNVLMAGDTTAPALPTQVEANGDYEGIIVTWLNPADVDFKHVEVHVSQTNTAPASSATPTAVIDGEQYIETNLNGGDVRYFFLRSVDFSGNKSAYTSSVFGIATSIRIKNLGLLLNQNAYPTDLPVAEIKEGEEYEVLTLGTTSAFGWGQLGSTGTVGNVFTATRDGGPEFGSGTVEHTSYVSNDGELALVGLNLNGTLRYGEDASVIWNGKPIDIPFNSSNNFTVLTNLAGKQGWIALDRNGTAPFDMSGTLPNLNVAFVYYFDGDWYYDDDSSNPVQFNPDSFTGTTTGTDGTTTAKILALGTLRTGTVDTIVEGGLFADPIDLRLVELPDNFIDVTKFATQLESDTYVSGTSGWKIERNGNTEFNDITARGAIFATSGSISESVQIGGVDLNDYVARVTGSLALLINKGGGGTTTNNGEGVLVGVEQGAAVNNQNGYITWDGAQVEIPANVTVSGSTFATQLENQQGFICFDANKETPFSVFSGTGYIDLDCAFVYKIGDQWYFDANDSATVGQTFTPSTLLGSDGSSATDLVALGYIETSTSDVILYGGLFGQPVPLELAAFPSDAIRSGTIGGITITDSKLFQGVGTFKDANTGFYLDSSGDFSLKDKLSFDNSAGELIVDGTVRADVIDIVDGALYGDVEASSVAAGQVGVDEVSEAVYNEIKRRFINTKDGFYFSDTGTVNASTNDINPLTITSGDLSATALQNENIELECVLTYRFTSTTNYSASDRNIFILFQWSFNGTSWSNVDVDPDDLHTVTQTQTEFGYVYELNKVIRSTSSFSFSYGYLRLRAQPATSGSSSIWAEHPLAVSFVADQAGLIVGSAKSTGEAQFPDGIIVDPGENVGIGELLPTANLHVDGTVQFDISQDQGFKVVATDDTANETFYAGYYDVNMSGADALTGNRTHTGLYIDVDSSATGGTTTAEHRIYGLQVDVDVTGDSDLVYAGNFDSRASQTSGTITNIRGATNSAWAFNSGGATNQVYGLYNVAYDYTSGTGACQSVYGQQNYALGYSTSPNGADNFIASFNKTQITGTQNQSITNATGVYANLQFDPNSNTLNVGSAYGVRAVYDHNDTDGSLTVSTGYLFHGDYQGNLPTNAYGVFILDDVDNYFAGRLSVGSTFKAQASIEVNRTNLLGSTFTGDTDGEGLAVNQTNYTSGNYVSLVEGSYSTSIRKPNVRMGAKYEGTGSSLVFGTSSSYATGITNEALTIDPSGNVIIEDGYLGVGTNSFGGRIVATGDAYTRIVADGTSGGAFAFYGGGSEHAQIFSDGAGDLTFRNGSLLEDRMIIKSDGKIGINQLTPATQLHVDGNARFVHDLSKGFEIRATDTTANQTYYGAFIDYNVSGADALTSTKYHYGLYVDADTSATGGDTTNEHRVYGVYADVRATGDSDLIVGTYGFARAQHTSGQITNVYGAQNYGFVSHSAAKTVNCVGAYNFGRNSNSGTGEVDNVYGAINIAQVYNTSSDAGTINYGSHNIVQITGSNSQNVSQARGVSAEVQIDGTTFTYTLSNAYAVRAAIDYNDADDGVTVTNGFLFYGQYEGTQPTNAYGVYIPTDVRNYFAGDIGIGNTPIAPLDVLVDTDDRLLFRNQGGTAAISAVNNANSAYKELQIDSLGTAFTYAGSTRALVGNAGFNVYANSGNLTHVFNYNESGGEINLYDSTQTSNVLIDASFGNARFINATGSGDVQIGCGGTNTSGNIKFMTAGFGSVAATFDASGNFDLGETGTSSQKRIRVYYNNDNLDVYGYGIQFNRVTNYLRPTTDGDKNLYFGNTDAARDWNSIHFRSVNGLYMTGTQFLTNGRNLVNIGSVNCGGITASSLSSTGSISGTTISGSSLSSTGSVSGTTISGSSVSSTGAISASGDLTTTAELGVGTTNPAWDAHIYGSGPTLMLESSSTADAELRFGYLSTTTARIRESADDLIFEAQGLNTCITTRPARTDILSSDTYIQSNTRLGGTSQMRINSSSSTAIMEGSSSFYVLRQTGSTSMSFQMGGSTETYGMTTNRIFPSADNTRDLGSSTRRWQDVYSAGGVTTSSDERLKQQVRDIDEAERRVAVVAKGLLKAYKYNDAVEKKGDDARWHFGIIAQELKAAFEAEGLDAHDYGMLVYNEVWEADEWVIDVDSEEGGWYTTKTWDTAEEAPDYAVRKDEYAIRYQELLAFIIAAL